MDSTAVLGKIHKKHMDLEKKNAAAVLPIAACKTQFSRPAGMMFIERAG
jgi:hypothetical protein